MAADITRLGNNGRRASIAGTPVTPSTAPSGFGATSPFGAGVPLPSSPAAPASAPVVQTPAPASAKAPPKRSKRKPLPSERREKAQRAATVRAPKVAPAPAPVRHRPHGMVLTAALGMAAVSGGYSIFGLASIFTGAVLPVIAMGVALEFAKLTAVAWMGKQLGGAALRGAITCLIAVLMLLNAIGAFGFLSKAHIGAELAGQLAVASKGADVGVRVKLATDTVADLDKRIAQIDDAIAAAIAKGKGTKGATVALDLANAQRKTRAGLVNERAEAGKALAGLQVEAAAVDGQKLINQADLGPVLYLAKVLHVPADDMLQWFIALIAILLDPAAVLLLMAATTHHRRV